MFETIRRSLSLSFFIAPPPFDKQKKPSLFRDDFDRGTTLFANRWLTTQSVNAGNVSSYCFQKNFSQMRFSAIVAVGLPLCSGSLVGDDRYSSVH